MKHRVPGTLRLLTAVLMLFPIRDFGRQPVGPAEDSTTQPVVRTGDADRRDARSIGGEPASIFLIGSIILGFVIFVRRRTATPS